MKAGMNSRKRNGAEKEHYGKEKLVRNEGMKRRNAVLVSCP